MFARRLRGRRPRPKRTKVVVFGGVKQRGYALINAGRPTDGRRTVTNGGCSKGINRTDRKWDLGMVTQMKHENQAGER